MKNSHHSKQVLTGKVWIIRLHLKEVIIIQFGKTGEYIFLSGLDQLHAGFEFEAAYQPSQFIRYDVNGSIADWHHTSDARGEYRESGSTKSYLVGADGLKIGDAPQTQLMAAVTVSPENGLSLRLAYRHYSDFYADWDATSRIVDPNATDPADRIPDRNQSWKVPDYSLWDFHGSYILPINISGVTFQLHAHIFNILDKTYVSDAVDNSQYNGYDQDHDADDAEVYLGLPRSFNIGLTVTY